MNIAIVHNLGTGGARRALHGHLVGLRARGHRLSLHAPRASEAYEPLAPLCHEAHLWGLEAPSSPVASRAGGDEGRVRTLARRVLGQSGYEQARDAVWTRRQRTAARAAEQDYQEAAHRVLASSPDLVYVHQCQMLLVPRPLLQTLAGAVPTVFYLHDTLRRAQEWPAVSDGHYEGASESLLRRRDVGRLVSPALGRWRSEERRRYEDGLRMLTRPGARLLVNSYYSRESTLRTSGVEGHVCYFGVDSDFFTPPVAGETRAREVLSVGALRPEKRHDRIIEAIARIAPGERPSLRIVGYRMQTGPDPYADGLCTLAEQCGVRLILDAQVTDEDLRAAYRRASLLVFAPYLEPFGLVPLEAAACETPVVAVAEGGPRETIRDGVTGLLTGGDPREIGAAIRSLLQDPDRAREMGRAGRLHVTGDWTWAGSLDSLEQHFASARAQWQEARQ